ncbi:MAG TPA: hypothetical protein DHV80_07500 [Acidimicrobiaceae bacterium]|nr:hypothetical protein [Acidimicrobiaceae bacterium]
MGSLQLVGFVGPSVNWWALLPQIILLGAALAVLLVSALAPQRASTVFATVTTLCAAVTSFVVALGLWSDVKADGPSSSIASAFGVDGFSIFFTVLILIGLATTALLSHGYLDREEMDPPEFHALLLCSAAGAIVMASANDLIVMFLGLEALSIGIYVMIAMHHRRSEARESAIKYFVLGAFSSAFLLYGIALTYGATGSTNLVHIRSYLDAVVFQDQHLLMAAMALLLVGLSFKVAAAPFHFWAPDVYQGAPSPVTGWMASIAKAAGFAALLRIFFAAFASHDVDWAPIVGALAVITLVIGSVMAILQTDIKRMLAFSSVSHAGYVLVAVHSASATGTSAALFYLFTYTLMVLGSFAIVGAMGPDDEHPLSRYTGLGRSRPVIAIGFTVLLLAQAGIPTTSGFIAKFQVIAAAVESESYFIAGVSMVTAVIGAFMYLRIVMAMYVVDEGEEGPRPIWHWTTSVVVLAAVGFTIIVGLVPQFLIEFARDAVPVLVRG